MTWANFTRDEFECECGNCVNGIDNVLIDRLQLLRDAVGFPLMITSGYRCPKHNDRVSTTGLTGPHVSGLAADIKVSRERAYHVLQEALRLGFTGIGVSQKGPVRFLHLDLVPGPGRPWVWSY